MQLSTSGINADPWTTAPLAAPRATSSSNRSRQAPRAKEVEKKSGMGSILLFVLLGFLVVGALAYVYRLKTASSDPESPSVPGASWSAPQALTGDALQPGEQRPPPPGTGKFLLKIGERRQPGIPFSVEFVPCEYETGIHDTNTRFAAFNSRGDDDDQ